MLLCDDLDRWNERVGGRLKRERIYVYIWPIHNVVQQKQTQYCKVLIIPIKRYMHPHVHCHKIYNSQDIEVT